MSGDAVVKRRGRPPKKRQEPVYVTYQSVMPLADADEAARERALELLGKGRKNRLKVVAFNTIILVNDTTHASR